MGRNIFLTKLYGLFSFTCASCFVFHSTKRFGGGLRNLKKKKKSDQGVWGEDFGTESREWWRRLHPPPLPANRIPTRQIYGRRAQVGASQIKCYFTCAIYFVGDAINHFHWGRRWGGGREKIHRCHLRRLLPPQITAAFHPPCGPPGMCVTDECCCQKLMSSVNVTMKAISLKYEPVLHDQNILSERLQIFQL